MGWVDCHVKLPFVQNIKNAQLSTIFLLDVKLKINEN